MEDFQNILSKLSGVTKQAWGWKAKCPAHDDTNASLSLMVKNDRLLAKCHAGCPFKAIAAAARTKESEWFKMDAKVKRKIVATYDYCDEKGLLFQVVRFEPKDFCQRRPDLAGGWIWQLGEVRRVLYRLPELLKADKKRMVMVVEGERDVETLRGLGFVATTNVGGAGKWRPEYSECLRGRNVVIFPDNDKPGRDHAEMVKQSLTGVARIVKVVRVPLPEDKTDISDWVNRMERDDRASAVKRLVATQPTCPAEEVLRAIKPELERILAKLTEIVP